MKIAEPAAIGVGAATPHEQSLDTEHLRHDLKGRFLAGGMVTISAQAAKFVLTLLSTMVLARLLGADDFGVLAMVTGAFGFMKIFKDAGLSTATVQREFITHAQVSNLFWINVVASGLVTVAVAALAPAIAWFYGDQRLLPVTLILSLTFVLSGTVVQHLALLNRQMRFKAIAYIEVGSLAVSVIIGIVLALLGCHYWSLVGAALALEATALGLAWGTSRWRPRWPQRNVGTRVLVGFGANLTVGNFLFSAVRGMDNVLIGWRYGSGSVGLYSRGTALLLRPLDQIMSPLSAVFLPMLSRLQSEPERYQRVFQRVNEAIMLVTFPMTAILLALAHPVTIALLGRKWEGAAPIFAGFTPAALQAPLTMAVVALYMSQGRGRELLVASAIISPLTLLSFVAGLPFGPVGVALSFSASGLLLRLPIHYFIVGRRGPVRTRSLWASLLRYGPLWGIVFLGTFEAQRTFAGLSPVSQLAICAPLGLLLAAVSSLLVPAWRSAAFNLLETGGTFLLSRAPGK